MAPVSRVSFRAGVGCIVLNERDEVLMGERAAVPGAWQFPQGGVDEGEDGEAAAWRELGEETGLTPATAALLKAMDGWVGYELPAGYRTPKTGRGQVHRWFAFRLAPGAQPIPADGEFRELRFVRPAGATELAVEFRQPQYRLVLRWIAEEVLGTVRQ